MNLERDSENALAIDWIRQMADGDTSALDALYRIYQPPLLAFFQTLLKDPMDAEEVLQDTFVRAFQNASRFDPRLGSPFSWLATIGKRLCLDRLRRTRHQPKAARLSTELSASRLDGNPHEEDHADKIANQQWVEEMLVRLPPAQREALQLAFFEGLTHAEIADALNRPLGTVKSDLHRALVALKSVSLRLQ